MKKILLIGLLTLLCAGLLAAGCKETQTDTQNTMPPLDNGTKSITIEVTGAEFEANPSLVKTVEVVYPGSVVLSLDSNQTTGFSWTAEPQISDPAVIYQYEHNYVAPESSGVVGAAGKEVWTFKPKATGTAVITFEYSQPWAGGTKSARTYELTIVVK